MLDVTKPCITPVDADRPSSNYLSHRAESVGAWLRFADPTSDDVLTGLKLNDYETYGAFIHTHHPNRTSLATWGTRYLGTRTKIGVGSSRGANLANSPRMET